MGGWKRSSWWIGGGGEEWVGGWVTFRWLASCSRAVSSSNSTRRVGGWVDGWVGSYLEVVGELLAGGVFL